MTEGDVKHWMHSQFSARSIVHTSVAVVITTLIMMAIFLIGPKIETKISPIVSYQSMTDFYRDQDRICWHVHGKKIRPADSPRYLFWAEPEQGPDIPTGAYLTDKDRHPLPKQELLAHKVGEDINRYFCFDVADRLPNLQKVHIIGQVEHRRHRFWASVTQLPAFDVCPLGQPQDGDC